MTCAACSPRSAPTSTSSCAWTRSPQTLRQRIIDREPDTFTELDELVAAAARLSPVIAGLRRHRARAQHRGRTARGASLSDPRRVAGEAATRLTPEGRRAVDSAPAPRDTGADGARATTSWCGRALTRSCAATGTRSPRSWIPGVEWLWHEPGDWDCHDRRKVLATLFERQREGVVTGLNAVVAVDERVFVEVTGPRLEEWGLPGGQACMVVTVRDGRIVRMQDYPNRAAALAGAGLPPEPAEAVDRRRRWSATSRSSTRTRRWHARSPRSSAPATARRGRAAPARASRAGPRAARRSRARAVPHAAARRHRLARHVPRRPRRSPRWSPRAPTSTPASPARTARRRCTGRPAATTSRRSTRCWTPAPTSRPTAP